ncbi:subtilisin-like serine protease [Tulasnella sp. 403]|nr:subtilisin-like serine protease [Tulasnella sp. 403]
MIFSVLPSLIFAIFLGSVDAAVPHWQVPGSHSHIVRLGDTTNKVAYLAALKQQYPELPSDAISFDYDPDFLNAFAITIPPERANVLDHILSDVTNIQYVVDDILLENDVVVQENPPEQLARMSSKKDEFPGWRYAYPLSAGSGVDIYVVDSGVNAAHQEFRVKGARSSTASRVRCGFSVTSDGKCDDTRGHGTAVASLAAGLTLGIAKKANIVAVKIRRDDGQATVATQLAGMAYVYSAAPSTGRPSVINYSFQTTVGDGSNEPPLFLEVVAKLTGAGIHFVNSASNDGIRLAPAYCAQQPFITVGALDVDDIQAEFSNYGPCVKFWARGVEMVIAGIAGNDSIEKDGAGTSFAAPLVAGVAALILAEKGSMAPPQLVDELQKGAFVKKGTWKGQPVTYRIPQAPQTRRAKQN